MRVPPEAARPANIINHIFIVGDMSPSMAKHKAAFVKVTDNLVAHLAGRSKELDQETRVSVYLFAEAGSERCVIWDKDVLRMPSIAEYYDPQYYGMTALIDATMLAIGDIGTEVSQKYGDHAVMAYVITDGLENNSRRFRSPALRAAIAAAPENQTFACFVPDQEGVFEAKGQGFPADNISVWDASSSRGVESMGEVLRSASDAFMEGRAQGIRGYNAKTGRSGASLFAVREFSRAEVTSALPPLTQGSYYFLDVRADEPIREFMTRETGRYSIGTVYYQHTKVETVQPQKEIAVEVAEDLPGGKVSRVYSGRAARGVLGLPDQHVKVKPNPKNGCTVFVQSTSPNRKLIGGTRVLVMR